MKLEPLKEFICDVCGEKILNPDDGYVVWKGTDNFKYHSFKIIHQGKCDDESFLYSQPLSSFLGLDGMQRLLCMVSAGRLVTLKNKQGENNSLHIKDFDEYVDFFRRVQTPFYEEARTKFNKSELLEWYDDANEYLPYMKVHLENIIDTYCKEGV